MRNSINEAVDLLQRRTRDYINEDKVGTVYAVFTDDCTTFYFVLDRCVDSSERIRMENRYRRMFNDVCDRYKVEVLNVENHLPKTGARFTLYSGGKGFSVPMEKRNTNRCF